MESKFEQNDVFKIDNVSQFQRTLHRDLKANFPEAELCIYSPLDNLQKIFDLENSAVSGIEIEMENLGIDKRRYSEVEEALNKFQIIYKLLDLKPIKLEDLEPVCKELGLDYSPDSYLSQFDKLARLFGKKNLIQYVSNAQQENLRDLSHLDLYIIIHTNNPDTDMLSREIEELIQHKLSLAGGYIVQVDDQTLADEDQMSKVIQAKQITPYSILLKNLCRFQKTA